MTATHTNDAADAALPGTGRIRVRGDVRSPRVLDMSDLRDLPQHEREIVFTCRTSGLRRHRFAGPLLLDVLRQAEPAFAPEERKDRLRFLIALRAADGHRVVLSWAEIDPEFGNSPILLGLVRDGASLDDQGPHLVVPGDVCGARNISRIVDLHLHTDTPW
jgi:hypothetical protein